jgi:anti-anti-sigma regulatory factor
MSLQTQPLVAEGYELTVTCSAKQLCIGMKGTFDMEAAKDLARFLGSVATDIRALAITDVIIDANEVYYLGSSCIKSLITLISQLKTYSFFPQLRIVINPRLDWHERAFAVLARLSPRQVCIEKGH